MYMYRFVSALGKHYRANIELIFIALGDSFGLKTKPIVSTAMGDYAVAFEDCDGIIPIEARTRDSPPPSPPGLHLSRVSSSTTLYSCIPGDSEFGSEEEGAAVSRSSGSGGNASVTAIAAVGAAPAAGRAQASQPPVRDTTPKTTEERPDLPSDRLNDRSDVGNIGWMFGNWGARARDEGVQTNIDLQIKRSPAQIIGLTECEALTEDILKQAAVAADPNAAAGSLRARPGFEYWTVRGDEEKSNMLAVRKNVAHQPELLFWERRFEGEYSAGKRKARAYSRFLVCRLTLLRNVGFFGKQMVVAVIHMHNRVANNDKGFRKNQTTFWPGLRNMIADHKIDVLMGDFNMSLFKVVPELRSRGIRIELIAWYPWKSKDGNAMADSCGIFLINKPCVVALDRGLLSLHNVDSTGIGHEDAQGYTRSVTPAGYAVFEANAGPGMPLKTYLPKAEDIVEKLRPSLTLGAHTAVAEAWDEEEGSKVGRSLLKVKEKRLEAEFWKFQGENHKGSHFPVCAFTDNVGRRSNVKFLERSKKAADRQWKRGPGSYHGGGSGSKDSWWEAPQWRQEGWNEWSDGGWWG